MRPKYRKTRLRTAHIHQLTQNEESHVVDENWPPIFSTPSKRNNLHESIIIRISCQWETNTYRRVSQQHHYFHWHKTHLFDRNVLIFHVIASDYWSWKRMNSNRPDVDSRCEHGTNDANTNYRMPCFHLLLAHYETIAISATEPIENHREP